MVEQRPEAIQGRLVSATVTPGTMQGGTLMMTVIEPNWPSATYPIAHDAEFEADGSQMTLPMAIGWILGCPRVSITLYLDKQRNNLATKVELSET